MYYEMDWQNPHINAKSGNDTITINKTFDQADKLVKTDTVRKPANKVDNDTANGKNYLLYAAYCVAAASAGFRFINMIVDNVVKEQKINKLEDKLATEKKASEKRIKNSQISQAEDAQKVSKELRESLLADPVSAEKLSLVPAVLPTLPAVTHPDDPQKGRFGGKPEVNHKRLKADVKESDDYPDYYDVAIWVESEDRTKWPLTDVIFYIHDSFSPSVYTIKTSEFDDKGRAMDNEILSYGAFTVGVITDNGETMLELDLAKDKLADGRMAPKEFRDR
jgi:hypothetical protein